MNHIESWVSISAYNNWIISLLCGIIIFYPIYKKLSGCDAHLLRTVLLPWRVQHVLCSTQPPYSHIMSYLKYMNEDEVSISKHLLIPLSDSPSGCICTVRSILAHMLLYLFERFTSVIFEAAVNATLTASGVSLDDLGIIITHAGNLSAKYPIRGKKTDVSNVMSAGSLLVLFGIVWFCHHLSWFANDIKEFICSFLWCFSCSCCACGCSCKGPGVDCHWIEAIPLAQVVNMATTTALPTSTARPLCIQDMIRVGMRKDHKDSHVKWHSNLNAVQMPGRPQRSGARRTLEKSLRETWRVWVAAGEAGV